MRAKKKKRLRFYPQLVYEVSDTHILVCKDGRWYPALLPERHRNLDAVICRVYVVTDNHLTGQNKRIVNTARVASARVFAERREEKRKIYRSFPIETLLLPIQHREQLVALRNDRVENFGGLYA